MVTLIGKWSDLVLVAGFFSFALLLLAAEPAQALNRGPAKVANTVHNLSTSGPDPIPYSGIANLYLSNNETQICVFCHTPHGGSTVGPLWNRTNPTPASWSHYNSVSLSGYLQSQADNRDPSDESMLCLSCHDGSVSAYSMINLSNAIEATAEGEVVSVGGSKASDPAPWNMTVVGLPGPSARIGAGPADMVEGTGDLSDDHPISFSYQSVYSEYVTKSRAGLKDPSTITTVQFFGTTQRVECSSCHDPHVDYTSAGDPDYGPFLITPNRGSALCLACHTK